MSLMSLATPTYGLNGAAAPGNSQPSAFMSPTAPIGGTSGGGQGAGSNVLSMNLGGVNVNYDMGPSTGEATNAAYNFLGNSFNADSALLGNTIVGSQNFLSGFASPILSMAQSQQEFNTQVLPSMFGTLGAQNYSLGSQAVYAEASVAQASVAASSATAGQAAGGGGMCFITTAVCEVRGESDNCVTLQKLRKFRDTYMQENNYRKGLVDVYYKIAPALVEKIKKRADAVDFLNNLHDRFITPAVACIDSLDYENAGMIYAQMLVAVQQEA
jgi:hypothetical protein